MKIDIEGEEASRLLVQQLAREQTDQHAEEEDDFACPICFEEYEEKNIMPLDSCDHVFHEDCLQEYLA
jgi:hypothetical protein